MPRHFQADGIQSCPSIHMRRPSCSCSRFAKHLVAALKRDYRFGWWCSVSQRCGVSLRIPCSMVISNNKARLCKRFYVVCGALEVTVLIMGHVTLGDPKDNTLFLNRFDTLTHVSYVHIFLSYVKSTRYDWKIRKLSKD